MKLSFSLPSKSNPKHRLIHHEEEKLNDTRHDYITEFDPTKPIEVKPPKVIIPPLENSWKFANKMSNLVSIAKASAATDDPESRFELEAAPTTPQGGDQGFKYGLTLRNEKVDDRNGGKSGVFVTRSIKNLMLNKNKENLTESRGFNDEPIDCPVEGYAEALLAGYGWKKGQGIGKNAKEEVLVAPKGKDGRVRHVVGTDGKLVAAKPKEFARSCKSQRHKKGIRAVVIAGRFKRRKIEVEARNAAKHDGTESSRRGKQSGETSWLNSHIRVRVVCKKIQGGKLYMKKGQIVDVVGRNVCDIAMEESKEVIQGVRQDILETVIPRRGGPVLILCGKHKGVFGNLVQKDTEKETGVVRDADNHELLNVRLEQIAEYIGDPSNLGY
ncbi:hypothetical protein MKW94_025809 [Papaver nudicaule]|uniref:G-patch domain-containing protein n=1 Tax=Papaver nudicaule TaxID=74823 RepID=A0AA42B3I0_PAPNU|nr:hypothetical protein [Papaver nudicaule]